MAPRIRRTGNYYTHQDYTVDFFGEELMVTVTPTFSVIKRWIRDVCNRRPYSSHPLVVGVGVQWTPPICYPDFSPHFYYEDPPADTLQLCVGERCLIIQLSHCERVPDELYGFLEDPGTTFVGVWNGRDARKLAESWHQLEIGELLDIRNFLVRGRRSCSFEVIVEQCLGHRGVSLDPEISLSDWSAYELDRGQILQASVDAYVCAKLGVTARLWEL